MRTSNTPHHRAPTRRQHSGDAQSRAGRAHFVPTCLPLSQGVCLHCFGCVIGMSRGVKRTCMPVLVATSWAALWTRGRIVPHVGSHTALVAQAPGGHRGNVHAGVPMVALRCLHNVVHTAWSPAASNLGPDAPPGFQYPCGAALRKSPARDGRPTRRGSSQRSRSCCRSSLTAALISLGSMSLIVLVRG